MSSVTDILSAGRALAPVDQLNLNLLSPAVDVQTLDSPVIASSPSVSVMSYSGDSYGGALSGGIPSYLEGYLLAYPLDHYCIVRVGQYDYYCYHGANMSANGDNLSGTGLTEVHYYSGTSSVNPAVIVSDNQTLDLTGGVYYTDVGDYGARLPAVTQARLGISMVMLLAVMCCLTALRIVLR